MRYGQIISYGSRDRPILPWNNNNRKIKANGKMLSRAYRNKFSKTLSYLVRLKYKVM